MGEESGQPVWAFWHAQEGTEVWAVPLTLEVASFWDYISPLCRAASSVLVQGLCTSSEYKKWGWSLLFLKEKRSPFIACIFIHKVFLSMCCRAVSAGDTTLNGSHLTSCHFLCCLSWLRAWASCPLQKFTLDKVMSLVNFQTSPSPFP